MDPKSGEYCGSNKGFKGFIGGLCLLVIIRKNIILGGD
jgi:hypothetical protein